MLDQVTWFHGTSEEAAQDILARGFNHAHNWFAVSVRNAEMMGGPVVLQVVFEADSIPLPDEGDQERWQMCVHEFIGPERVSRYGTST